MKGPVPKCLVCRIGSNRQIEWPGLLDRNIGYAFTSFDKAKAFCRQLAKQPPHDGWRPCEINLDDLRAFRNSVPGGTPVAIDATGDDTEYWFIKLDDLIKELKRSQGKSESEIEYSKYPLT